MDIKTKICGFYPEEIQAIKNALNIQSESMTDIKRGLLLNMGIQPHERVILTIEEKTARSISKMASQYAVPEADLKKALALLRLKA